MTDNNNDESVAIRSVRMPVFDGTHATFQVWWTRFTAFAIVHRFKAAISPEGAEEDLPATEATAIPTGADGAAGRAAMRRRRNSVAYANLSLALNSEQLVRILVAGQTTAWPSGLAWRVVQALHRRFKPADIISKIELRRMLNQISMSRKEDPVTLFEQISKIENQFSTTINKADAIAIVMDAAPDEYQAILNTEQLAKGDDITLQDLAETMDQQWRSLYGQRKTKTITGNDGNDTEVALAAFAGKCHNCQQVGHRAADCPHKKTQTKTIKTSANAAAIVGKWDTSRQIVGIGRRTPTNAPSGTNLHVSTEMNKSTRQLTMATSTQSVNCYVWPSRRKCPFHPSPNSSRIHVCGLVIPAQQNTSPHTPKE